MGRGQIGAMELVAEGSARWRVRWHPEARRGRRADGRAGSPRTRDSGPAWRRPTLAVEASPVERPTSPISEPGPHSVTLRPSMMTSTWPRTMKQSSATRSPARVNCVPGTTSRHVPIASSRRTSPAFRSGTTMRWNISSSALRRRPSRQSFAAHQANGRDQDEDAVPEQRRPDRRRSTVDRNTPTMPGDERGPADERQRRHGDRHHHQKQGEVAEEGGRVEDLGERERHGANPTRRRRHMTTAHHAGLPPAAASASGVSTSRAAAGPISTSATSVRVGLDDAPAAGIADDRHQVGEEARATRRPGCRAGLRTVGTTIALARKRVDQAVDDRRRRCPACRRGARRRRRRRPAGSPSPARSEVDRPSA